MIPETLTLTPRYEKINNPIRIHHAGNRSRPDSPIFRLPSPQDVPQVDILPIEPSVHYPERWKEMYQPKFNISNLHSIDSVTQRWIRTAADERAAHEGMKFSEELGQFVVDWVQDHCILYEGSKADTPLICDDWQYEYFMQMFGWQRFSPELNRWIRRFRRAGIWIAKKNAKSPTLAATALYMLMGDGEPGQKCYAIARDGKQAMIAFTHAMEMVKSSPLLQEECRINHSNGTIRHIPSKSVYSIVHMENYKSTEGYNGSLFVDETHVVQQQHMDRVKRAGISRDEPVHIEMSTSGNNVDEYGYDQYIYGKKVTSLESDDIYNPEFLFIDFSIDQRVTLEDLRDETFVREAAPKCNPALGRIIRLEEFMSDWRDSQRSDTELRNFAMYRLNLWLKGTSPWLEVTDWSACKRDYSLEDLVDYPCVAGLDLSRTKDMTALSLIFAVPDEDAGMIPYTWTWHWIPYQRAVAYKGYVDLFNDSFSPWITFVKQSTIDYSMIIHKLEWIRTNFDLRGLGYDAWKASDLVRTLIIDYGWSDDYLIKVPQNMKYIGPITQEFERWVIRGEVAHPNNALLTWQFSHVELDVDKAGNYRPVKPDPNSYKKIDGIMSLLDAGAVLVSDESIWCPKQSILLYDRETLSKDSIIRG